MRSVTAASTWSATVRPKRASQATGIASPLTIVPIAVASAIRAPKALPRVSVSVSDPSSWESSMTATEIFFAVSPGSNRSMPEPAS